MKKIVKLIVVLLSVVIAMIIITPDIKVQATNKVTLNKSKVTLYVGESMTLKLKNATKKVTWSSSDEDVTMVTSKGKIRAIDAGNCKIIAKSNGKKYICMVTVKKQDAYGSIEGNISYHYNQYRGYVSDTGARVSVWNGDKLVAYARVDGNGNYKIQHIPVGSYDILISSNNCKSEYVLNNWDDIKNQYGDDYWKVLNVSGTIYMESVEIYKNESTDVSHAFPYSDF